MLETNFTPFPVLETERLILRDMKDEDAADFFTLRSDENVMKYIARPRAKTTEDALALIHRIRNTIQANDGINWGITLKNEDKIVGSVGLVRFKKENYRAELGYLLSPHLQRKGIMSEAIHAVLNYGFKVIGLHSVEAIIDPENIASASILLKNNFKLEAHFLEDFFYENQFLDSKVFSLLARNFKG